MKRILFFWFLMTFSIPYVWADVSLLRQDISLNGPWDFYAQPGETLDVATTQSAEWKPVTVPHAMFGTPMVEVGADYAWYRKKILIPEVSSDKRIDLCFYGVGPHAVLYVNGRRMGENWLMMTPWVTDVTDAVASGQEAEILVGIESTTRCARKGDVWTTPFAFVIGEINGSDQKGGIWYEVWLKVRPAIYTRDVHIRTSFRRKKMQITVLVANGSEKPTAVTMKNVVMAPDGKEALKFNDAIVEIPANARKTVVLEKDWPSPHLWFPHDPYLYQLQTTLERDGERLDDKQTRFGFREYWVEKTTVKFNGVNAPVRRTSDGPCFIQTDRNSIGNLLNKMKQSGVNNVRWHSCPVPEYLLDISDEIGMLITQEGEMWVPYHYELTDLYWDRFNQSWAEIARLSRNHPSTFMYSLANESIDSSSWTQPDAPYAKRFKQIIETVRQNDPDTFITAAAGDDLWGASEFRDWHYPNNLSARWCVPNAFYWLADNPHPGSPERPGHRDKPLLIGEDNFDGFRMPLGAIAAFAGEDYYLCGPMYYYNHPGYVEIVRLRTDAYRMIPTIAINNPGAPSLPDSWLNTFPPVAVLSKDLWCNFFSGMPVNISYGLANEVWFDQKLSVKWQLISSDKKVVLEGTSEESMPAGTVKTFDVKFMAPEVKEKTGYILEVSVSDADKVLDVNKRNVYVFPQAPLTAPEGMAVAVFDPANTISASLKKLGLKFRTVNTLSDKTLKNVNTLLIGPDVPAAAGRQFKYLNDFLAGGGDVFVFEQSKPIPGLPGESLPLDGGDATMTFPRRADHPVLKGLTAENLRWWGPDHWVAQNIFLKPFQASYRVLTEAGDPMGMRLSPLMEYTASKGRLIYCQYLAGRKLLTEPAAQMLVQNTLDYFATPKSFGTRAGLLAKKNGQLAQSLARMKSKIQTVTGRNVNDFDVILVEGTSLPTPANLKSLLAQGKTVVIKSVLPGQETILEALTGRKMKIQPITPYQGIRGSDQPLVSGIGQYDLWWRLGDWMGRQDGSKPVLPFCDYVLEGAEPSNVLVVAKPKWEDLSDEQLASLKTTSAALLEIPVGKGRLIIDQLNWDKPQGMQAGFQYAASLLSNLGIAFGDADKDDQSDKNVQFTPISLKKFVNHTLRTDLTGGASGILREGVNNLAQFPMGANVPVRNIPFDVNGMIVLRSPRHAPEEPKRVDGIPCNLNVDGLHFLHGCAWSNGKAFTYVMHYEDGTTQTLDIEDGKNVLDWWSPAVPIPGATVAWQGRNEVHLPLTVYLVTWKNPKPNIRLTSIDLVGADSESLPFIVGITAERRKDAPKTSHATK